MWEYIKPYVGEFITGLIMLALGWLGKGKVQKRSDNTDLTAKIQSVYKEMVADTDAKMDTMREEIDALKKKQQEIDENWKKKIASVEKKWQTKYNALKAQFENYKKAHP